jgi:lambda family phage portal protein
VNIAKDIQFVYNGLRHVFNNRPSAISKKTINQKQLTRAFNRGVSIGQQQFKMYGPGADTGVIRADWRTTISSISSVISADFEKVCARAEELYRTYPIARRAISFFSNAVIGTGARPYPAIRYSNGNQPKLVNERLANDWERFVDEGVRNGTAKTNYYESQAIEFCTMGVYGSVLSNVVNSKPGSLLPYAFQLLKPTRLDFSKDTMFETNRVITSMDNKKVIHGIEINDYAEPKRFYLTNQTNPISADNMLLSFFPIETEQYLGLSWLYPVMCAMWDHDQLFSDKLKISRIGSRFGIKMPPESRAGIDTLLNTDGSTGETYLDLDFQGLFFGKDKPEPISITDPINDTFKPLVDMIMGYIAMGMGFSYQAFTTDLQGANFSGARTNTISDNRTFTGAFKKFVDYSGKPKWEKFVEWEVQTGRLAEYGITPAVYNRDRWYYNQSIWLPMDYQEWVDPLKDRQALVLAYKSGQITPQEYMSMNGKYFPTHVKELKEQIDFLKEQEGLEYLLPENISINANAPAKQEENVNADE